MKVREAKPSETEKLVQELWLPLAREMEEVSDYNKLREDLDTDKVEKRKRRKIKEKGNYIYVAIEDEEFIGLISSKVKESAPVFSRGDKLKITELYVTENYRREGVASELLDRMESLAEEESCETIELDVNKANESARELYRENGFEVERERMFKEV